MADTAAKPGITAGEAAVVTADSGGSDAVASGAPVRRRRLGQLVKTAVTLVIIAAIAYFVVTSWDKVRDTWGRLTWGALLLSVVSALIAMAASSAGWRDAARDVGSPVSLAAATRVFVIGQLGKYVPGTLWMYALQTELGRRAGIPRARAFLASMIAMALGITGALVVSGVAMPTLLGGGSGYSGQARLALYVMLGLLPVALVCSSPPVLTALVGRALHLLRRPQLEQRLSWGGVSRVLGWNFVAYLAFGMHLWLIVGAGPAGFPGGYLRCVAAFAVALVVGMFALLPGGVGVREFVLVVALAPFLTGDSHHQIAAATGLALASRFVILIAELLGAGLAALTDPAVAARIRGLRRVA